MKRYILQNSKLQIEEVAKPEGELIEVKAIGVNRADVFYLQNKYPVFGLEFAGIYNGKRVAGLVDGGAYAEFIEAEKAVFIEIPQDVSFKKAASLTESLVTAYYNLIDLCDLQKGEKILIHGGGSGVGVAAIQLAKAVGAEVAATAGKAEKLELIEKLGAIGIDYNYSSFLSETESSDNSDSFDVILDIVGGDYFNANLRALKKGGRLAIISFIGSVKTEANLAPILLKNLSIYGSTIRSLSREKKLELLGNILPYLAKINAVIDREFVFDEVQQAIDYVGKYKNIGKVIVTF